MPKKKYLDPHKKCSCGHVLCHHAQPSPNSCRWLGCSCEGFFQVKKNGSVINTT